MQNEYATPNGIVNALDHAEDLDADIDHLSEQVAYGVEQLGERHGLAIDLGAALEAKRAASEAAHRRGFLRLAGL